MLDPQIVADDKEVDGVKMVFGILGEGIRFSHEATDPRPQGAKPTLHVVGFAFRFATAAMGSAWKRRGAGFPVVAAGCAILITLGQRRPQVTRTLQATVAQGVGHNLAGSSAKGHPQPERLGLGSYKAPEFIQFQPVALFARQQRVHEGG